MRRRAAITAAVLSLVLLLTGCWQRAQFFERTEPKSGIWISAEKRSQELVTLVIHNDTAEEISVDFDYVVEVLDGGEWVRHRETPENIGPAANSVKPGKKFSYPVSVKALEPGRYRLAKRVGDQWLYTNEFSLR